MLGMSVEIQSEKRIMKELHTVSCVVVLSQSTMVENDLTMLSCTAQTFHFDEISG